MPTVEFDIDELCEAISEGMDCIAKLANCGIIGGTYRRSFKDFERFGRRIQIQVVVTTDEEEFIENRLKEPN